MITAITPTGDRPLAFELCRKWMSNQLRKPDQWLVIDDGKEPLPNNLPNMQYIRREPQPDDPKHTLNLNLLAALPHIAGDKIVIIEDDDYYGPEYISDIALRLNYFDLCGYDKARYYHIYEQKYFRFLNTDYASLCQTGFRRIMLDEFEKELRLNEPMLDVRFWRKSKSNKRLFNNDTKILMIGIKGLPGRNGIGAGHNPGFGRYIKDVDYKVFKEWLPDDYGTYLEIIDNNSCLNKRRQSDG